MIKIEFPTYQPKIKNESGKEFIFDEVRKKWVVLTPEEWVRQNFLQYLIQVKKYPATLIAVEKGLQLGELNKRADIVLYNNTGTPIMIIECKEMNVTLEEKVLAQTLRYHISLPVDYLVITNGSYTFAFEKKNDNFEMLDTFPL